MIFTNDSNDLVILMEDSDATEDFTHPNSASSNMVPATTLEAPVLTMTLNNSN